MDIDGQISIIDKQSLVDVSDPEEVLAEVAEMLLTQSASKLSIDNPHSWEAYITRHIEDLKTWLA